MIPKLIINKPLPPNCKMSPQHLLTICLLLFGNYILTSDAESVLVTNYPATVPAAVPAIAPRAAGDNIFCISVSKCLLFILFSLLIVFLSLMSRSTLEPQI